MAVHSSVAVATPPSPLDRSPHVRGTEPVEPARIEESGRRIGVLVVHGHDIVRLGFRLLFARLPWVERCLGASNAENAMALWCRYEPHVALVDLFVDATAGSDLCVALRRARPHGRVLLMSSSERMTRTAVRSVGASGFVPTGSSAEAIVQAVRLAGMGRMISQPKCAQPGLLSKRQREVLRLMAAGETNQEIGSTLGLSAHTVKGHTCALYRRLQVRNRAEAVRRAQQIGLLA